MSTSQITPTSQVKIITPSGGDPKAGWGSKVFINGVEFEHLCFISYATEIGADDVLKSTISLTFNGDILVERAPE